MRYLLKTSIILVGLLSIAVAAATPDFYAGFHNLPKSVSVYHYKVLDKVLEAQVLAAMQKAVQQGETKAAKAMEAKGHGTVTSTASVFVLPQLYVFDKKGQEIFARTAASNDLTTQLDHAFSSAVPLRTGRLLRTWLDTLEPDGNYITAKPQTTGKFTVLEYWAPWCVYCFVERDQLLKYFRKRSDLRVNWITVNADITKITGTHSVAPSSP